MTNAISVKNLSKQYMISHQAKPAYNSLRDEITNSAKNFVCRLINSSPEKSQSTVEEFWALKDVSFDIKQGDRVGIVGRNGAGKSTLLKVLSRIIEPTAGKVNIQGRVASLLEVGTGFHPELTGRENIYLNGAILGMSRAEIKSKFDQIVDFSEVERFLDTPVKRYSSGMYVRLAFAVAAHLEPEILIVDEVLAVGDASFQKKCLGKLDQVGEDGRTVLFVSHNLSMVSSLCNKGIMLESGRIITTGDIGEVVSRYTSGSESSSVINFGAKKVGDEYARLLSIAVLDGSGSAESRVAINNDVAVEITFEILQSSNREFLPRLDFMIDGGHCAFISFGTQVAKKYTSGQYKVICHIPANFLNQGTYYLTVGLVSLEPSRILHFYERSVILFEVYDPIVDVPTRAKGMAVSVFPGSVRPVLEWRADNS